MTQVKEYGLSDCVDGNHEVRSQKAPISHVRVEDISTLVAAAILGFLRSEGITVEGTLIAGVVEEIERVPTTAVIEG